MKPDPNHEEPDKEYRVNLLRPRPGFMRREVGLIWLMLLGWGLMTFGFQILLILFREEGDGLGPLTETTFFGFPFHYWFTGQFLIVWFILLCLFFNLFIDHLSKKYRKRR